MYSKVVNYTILGMKMLLEVGVLRNYLMLVSFQILVLKFSIIVRSFWE